MIDLDKETVQITAIVCGTAIAVSAMVFDGEVGNAVGTTLLTTAGTVAGYLFGKEKCKPSGVISDAKKVQESDCSCEDC